MYIVLNYILTTSNSTVKHGDSLLVSFILKDFTSCFSIDKDRASNTKKNLID